jgi:hypothetical protein
MSNCCQSGLLNTGKLPCIANPDYIVGVYLVPLNSSTPSVQNFIDLSQDFEADDLLNKLRATSPLNRWYPIMELVETDMPIADTTFETTTDGVKTFLFDGIRSFVAEKRGKNAPIKFAECLKKLRCSEWGVFIITANNMLLGERKNGDRLYPFAVNPDSFDPKAMFKTVGASQKLMLAFDLKRSVDLSRIYALVGSDLTEDVDFVEVNGLIDVELIVANEVLDTTLQFDLHVNDKYRSGLNPSTTGSVTGLVAADFALTIDGSTVTITSISEVTDGSYSVVAPAGSAGEEVVLRTNVLRGYDGTVTFTHPA